MQISPLKKDKLPNPPKSILKLLGPSFVLIGLGLGTGELILWPYLVSNYGLGSIWGAALGISLQFFLNMEIERYTLANGESVFVGFACLFRAFPIWFVLSTILAWSWPGFSASATEVLKPFGIKDSTPIAIGMLVLVGIILTFGPVLYKTVERFQKTLILVGIPLILLIVIYIVKLSDVNFMIKGLFGVGEGYLFLPKTIPLMSFLAAFAYSGAGGNLNLAQSFYIKEKGYGMGKYSGRITSLITGKSEKINIEGTTFDPNQEQIKRFNKWWKMVNVEHGFVFWFLGLATILMMALLSFATTYGKAGNAEGLNFLFNQASVISAQVGSLFGGLLLVITSLMLFATQLAIIDGGGKIGIGKRGRAKIPSPQPPSFLPARAFSFSRAKRGNQSEFRSKKVRASFSNCDHSRHFKFSGERVCSLAPPSASKAKCAAKKKRCCPCPTRPYAGNDKKLPFCFTIFKYFGNIILWLNTLGI